MKINKKMQKLVFASLFSLTFIQANAQSKTNLLTDRVKQIAENIVENPHDLSDILSESFKSKVSGQQLKNTLIETFKSVGKCAVFAQSKSKDEKAGSFLLKCEKGILPIEVSVEGNDLNKINGLFIRKAYQEVSKNSSLELKSGLHYPDQVAELLATSNCKLPTGSQFIEWASSMDNKKPTNLEGFYWISSGENEVGYANYVHWPTRQIVEYGGNVFLAKLAVYCKNWIDS